MYFCYIILYIQNRAVSHTSNAKKYTIQVKWTAPSAQLGNIEFRYTFTNFPVLLNVLFYLLYDGIT